MRIQTASDFANRPNKIMYEKPKYFLIYEGDVTEPMYFDGIIKNRNKLSINQSLNIISVLRSISDSSKSHPKYAFQMATEIKTQTKKETIKKENFRKSIIDFLKKEKVENEKYLIDLMNHYIESYAPDYIDYNEINNIILDMFKDDIFQNIVQEIIEYLDTQRELLDYNSEIDVINLIVDRDKGNFKETQYDSLVTSCKDNNINLYVSNPCFEVWLLMHFDEFETLDFEKLLENKRVKGKQSSRKYSDKMLSEFIGYNKSKLKFDLFADKIDAAIAREKRYAENVIELKDKIGSNIGKLIENMRK